MTAAMSGPRMSTAWVCRACSSSLRSFSTTTNRLSVPPESPRFLEVPQPPQKFVRKKTVIKGKLPVPKDLFTRKGKGIASPAWLDATTPEPKERALPQTDDDTSRLLWKQRMADLRRQNLREGVMELYDRRRRTEKTRRVGNRLKAADLLERASAPEPDYETLTRPSVNEVLRDVFKRDHGWQGASLAERSANFEAHSAAQAAARRDALHTLYMHARHFITTEEQLDAAVESAFTHADGRPKTESFWADEGTRPLTTQEMLGATRGADANLVREERASGRMRKLAEELTGGKIADEWTSGRL